MELNPQHPVTQATRDQWHKLCALTMWKLGTLEVSLTDRDIEKFMESGVCNIVAHDKGDRLVLMLVTEEEAKRLAGVSVQ